MKYASVELVLPLDCIAECSAPGPADDAVAYWIKQPVITEQLASLSLEDTARILYGYGAWEANDLTDLNTNLQRILWIAAGDCRDSGDAWAYLEGHGYERELGELMAA